MVPSDDASAAVKRVCRVQGVAVCCRPDTVYYIPLNPAGPGGLKLVGAMLANKRAKKITYDLKAQMLALLAGTSFVSPVINSPCGPYRDIAVYITSHASRGSA